MYTRFLKNVRIYFFVNLLSQASAFFVLFIIARIFSPSEVGIYVLSLFIIDFFCVVSIFGLNSALTRFYHSEEKVKEITNNAITIFFFSSLLSIILLLLSAGIISMMIPSISEVLTSHLMLFCAVIVLGSLYNFGLSHYTALRESLSYAKINFLQTIVFLFSALAFLFLDYKIIGIFYALSISYVAAASVFFVKEISRYSLKDISRGITKDLLIYCFPMMLYAVIGIITAYASRIFLDRYSTLSSLGIYGFFLVITLQVNALWATFNRAWTPEIFSAMKENTQEALHEIKTAAFLFSALYLFCYSIFVIIGTTGIFSIFLKHEYLLNIQVLYILLLGPLFNGIYTVCYPLYYYGKNKTNRILFISVLLSVVDILLTFFMVRSFGQTGALLSFVAISILGVLVFLFSFRKSMSIPKEIINWTIFLSLTMTVAVYVLLKTSLNYTLLLFTLPVLFLAYQMGDLQKLKGKFKSLGKNSKKVSHEQKSRVLFYTSNLRTFHSILIGYLYEISQVYPVILLSEKLDSKTYDLIKNKDLFPKIEEIIHVGQYDDGISILKKNTTLSKQAKELVEKYNPRAVFAQGSFLFESYLRKFAQKKGVLAIDCAGFLPYRDKKEFTDLRMGLSIYSATYSFLPMFLRESFIKIKKKAGHFFYYWILPVLVGCLPFVKTPSVIFYWDFSKVNGFDYTVVYLKRDKDFLVKHGAPAQKVAVVPHPMNGMNREIMKKIYSDDFYKKKDGEKIVTIMWPPLPVIFIKGGGYKFISEKETEDFHFREIKIILEILKGWKIIIKPHPMVNGSPEKLRQIIERSSSLSSLIEVVNPDNLAENYIELSDVIIGFQPACTTLFSSLIQCPEKPIISLDLKHELMGNCYKDFEGIEYVDDEEVFVEILQSIKDGKYKKNYYAAHSTDSTAGEFSNIIELLNSKSVLE